MHSPQPSNSSTVSSKPASKESGRSDGGGSAAPLSLPKGGGALKGLNEKFSVDAFTGTASSSISIFEPVGRLQKLGGVSAAYNSGGGNGPMGIGWSIGTSSVKRRTDKGVPTYGPSHCTNDIFVAPGTDDLIRVAEFKADGWQVIRYRSRIEKAFSLVEQFVKIDKEGLPDEANSFWRVISKGNVLSLIHI